MRSKIESRLPKLPSPGYIYESVEPDDHEDDERTLVALHGAGGNEHDLIQIAKEVSGRSAIVTPRGKVLENR
jgi:predicted esterase